MTKELPVLHLTKSGIGQLGDLMTPEAPHYKFVALRLAFV